MHLTRSLLPLLFVALLGACTQPQKDDASQALDAAGNETSASMDKMRNYFEIGHKPKTPTGQPAQPRYCYKTYEDVICYDKPIPGEEYRMVGFQTPDGKVGYVMNPAPVPAGGEDLPPLKKVDVPSPPEVKADSGSSQLKEIIFDPAELQPKELVPEKPE